MKFANNRFVSSWIPGLWIALSCSIILCCLGFFYYSGNKLLRETIRDAGVYSQLLVSIGDASRLLVEYEHLVDKECCIAEENKAYQYFKYKVDKAQDYSLIWSDKETQNVLAEIQKNYKFVSDAPDFEAKLNSIAKKLFYLANHLGDFQLFTINQKYNSNMFMFYSWLGMLILMIAIIVISSLLILRRANQMNARSKAYRLETLGKLAAGHAHSVGSIVTGLRMGLGQFENKIPKELLKHINLSLRRLETTSQWMHYAASPNEISDNDIPPVLWSHTKEMLLGDFGESSRLEISSDLGDTDQIPISIEMVLTELIRNAEVHGEPDNIIVEAWQKYEKFTFIVSDDGSGMCPGTIMSATEPYFSTMGGQNNGLGLSAAKSIIKSHSGELFISSNIGEGTRIEFTFKRQP